MSIEEPQTKKIRIPCSLREIADNNLFFFDKTLEVIKLTKILHYQEFIALPRHFGKTMTVDMKIWQSDNFYYATCETNRCVIHLLASTNNDPSIKQILPLLSYYGIIIP